MQISGLHFTYTGSQGSGTITGVWLGAAGDNSTPIPNDASTSYTGTANSFMMGGGDGFTVLEGASNIVQTADAELVPAGRLRRHAAEPVHLHAPTDGSRSAENSTNSAGPRSHSANAVARGADYMGVRDWIRPAVAAVLSEYARLDPDSLTSGLLHSDPAPEAFRIDRSTGVVGLIDWGAALSGPLLYDLASAVMYVGGLDRADVLIDAYLASGALPTAEVERGVSTMLRFRWAIQAMYFAWRTVNDDLTGIADGAGNEQGLADAMCMLT